MTAALFFLALGLVAFLFAMLSLGASAWTPDAAVAERCAAEGTVAAVAALAALAAAIVLVLLP